MKLIWVPIFYYRREKEGPVLLAPALQETYDLVRQNHNRRVIKKWEEPQVGEVFLR